MFFGSPQQQRPHIQTLFWVTLFVRVVKLRSISCPALRDFHAEINDLLAIRDPKLNPEHTQIWTENMPIVKQQDDAICKVDGKLKELSSDARKAAWTADTMKLARDCAALGQLYQRDLKSQRSQRIQKVLHMKNQNTIGASVVSNFMSSSVAHRYGKAGELEAAVGKASFRADDWKSLKLVHVDKNYCWFKKKCCWLLGLESNP